MEINEIRALEPLFGGWYVIGKIGEGMYSKVYRLRREDMNGQVSFAALKTLHFPRSRVDVDDALSLHSFESVQEYIDACKKAVVAEAELLVHLSATPNMMAVHNYMIHDDITGEGFTLMLLCEQLFPLSEAINAENADEQTVCRMGVDICRALEGLEAAGHAHGAINPESIFVNANGNFKLGDFEICTALSSGGHQRDTSGYIAPESYTSRMASIGADIYSLGILMYKLMNRNRLPFYPPFPDPISFADREIAFEKRVRGEMMLPPANAGEQFSHVILKACEFSPRMRYENPSEMANDLILAAAGKLFPEIEPQMPPVAPPVVEASPVAEEEYTTVKPPLPVVDDAVTRVIPTVVYEQEMLPVEEPEQHVVISETPEEKEKRQNKLGIIIIAVLCALIVLIGSWLVWRTFGGRGNEEEPTTQQTVMVEVPNFVNNYYSAVAADPNYKGVFVFEAEYVFSETANDVILKQNVLQGTKAVAGSTIKLTVSKGPEKIIAIDVVGKSYNEAYEMLRQLGFSVIRSDLQNDGTHIQETVETMSVTVGEQYDKGTEVVLTVWGAAPTTTEPTTEESTVTTTEPTTVATTAPTTTEPSTRPPLTTEPNTNVFNEEGLRYVTVNPVISYSSDEGLITGVNVVIDEYMGTAPKANKKAVITEYFHSGQVSYSVDADVVCSEADDGSYIMCSVDLTAEDFTHDPENFYYVITFPADAIVTDTCANRAFSAYIE